MTEHRIKWSHSSLKDYEGCARRYHEVKVLNNYPFQETEQTRYGKELHKAAEDYVKDGTPIPKQWCQSSLRLLSTTLGTLRKAHCATGAQYAHANFTQNIRSKSWHVITKKNTSAT
jgi:hypothetical protein